MAQYFEAYNDHSCINKNNWKLGNIFSFDYYRDTKTLIVGPNGVPIMNPDYSNSGYLTIPVEITEHFENAYDHFKDIIDDTDRISVCLELYGSDKYIYKLFNICDDDWIFELWFSDGELESIGVINNADDNADDQSFSTIEEVIEYLDNF